MAARCSTRRSVSVRGYPRKRHGKKESICAHSRRKPAKKKAKKTKKAAAPKRTKKAAKSANPVRQARGAINTGTRAARQVSGQLKLGI